MKYNVWLLTNSGKPAPAGPSPIHAPDLVSAQRLAESTLAELQANHALIGWSVLTVTEAD